MDIININEINEIINIIISDADSSTTIQVIEEVENITIEIVENATLVNRKLNINGNEYSLFADREWRVAQADTGVLTFGIGITSATTSTINIDAITGYIIDNETDPSEPLYTFIDYSGQTNVAVTTLSGTSSYVMLDSNGISFQTTFPTSTERKAKIWLGKIGHPLGLITVVANEPDFITSPLAQHRDLFQAFNYINDSVFAYASGSTLSFNTTGGNVIGNGINLHNSRTNPNQLFILPQESTNFLYRTQTGNGDGLINLIDPNSIDINGIITPIVSGASIQHVFLVPNGGYIIQYGQNQYATLLDAVANVGKESFVLFPNLEHNALLIGVIAVKFGATNLSDTTHAQFFKSDKLGQIIGAAGGTSTTTLQGAYNNSINPQIITNSTLGALTIKDGLGVSGGTFNVINSANTSMFIVNNDGNIGVNTISPRIVPNYTFVTIEGSVGGGVHFRSSGGTNSGGVFGDTAQVVMRSMQPNIPLSFLINNIERMQLSTSGNLLAGMPYTEVAGYKLQSSSDALLNGVAFGRGGGSLASNVIAGDLALVNNTTGIDNTAVGRLALNVNTTGSTNTSIGRSTLRFAQITSSDTAIGYQAFTNKLSGNTNTAIGYNAGASLVSNASLLGAIQSVFLGAETRASGNNETNQVVIGYNALGLGSNSVTLGNDFITKTALKGNVLIGTTSDNGVNKLQVNGDAIINSVIVGRGSGNLSSNVVVGDVAFVSNTTGTENTIMGRGAGNANLTGNRNTVIGRSGLFNSTSGDSNVVLGVEGLQALTGGSFNIGIGTEAGRYVGNVASFITTASQSIFIGYRAASNFNNQTNQIVIGHQAIGNGTNSITLGNTAHTRTILSGNILIGGTTDSNQGKLQVTGVTTLQGTILGDSATLGAELGTTATGTNWAGTSLLLGYTHTIGSTVPLTNATVATIGAFYQLDITITNRTTGSITAAYGGVTNPAFSSSLSFAPKSITTAGLVITPTTDFNGTVAVSIKQVTSDAIPSLTLRSSNGGITREDRFSNSNTNYFSGVNAGRNNTNGVNNTFIGHLAGNDNTTGLNNTFVGETAGQFNNGGQANTFLGSAAGQTNTVGTSNTFVGILAGFSNVNGNFNTFMGQQAGNSNTTGNDNVALGLFAGFANTTGLQNTSIGRDAGRFFIGTNNVSLGYQAGKFLNDKATSLTGSTSSVFIGNNTSASGNGQSNQIVIGFNANGLGSNTTVIGSSATTQTSLGGRVTIGGTLDNGTDALQITGSTTTTNDSTFNGVKVGKGGSSVSTNLAVGFEALLNNTTGLQCVAIGNQALSANTVGILNTAVGYQALRFNISGGTNTAVGRFALTNIVNTNQTVGFGSGSGILLNDNTTILSAATQSVFLGVDTRANANNETNQIVIGYLANGIGSNSVVLGNDSITKTALKGNVLIGTTTDTNQGKLQVSGSLAANLSRIKITNTDSTNYITIGAGIPSVSNQGLNFTLDGASKMAISTNGNLLINTTTDNSVDKLQVNGSAIFSGTVKSTTTIRLQSYTVATLPAGVQGDTAYVTNALTPTYLTPVVGGGAVVTPVFYNGTTWVCH